MSNSDVPAAPPANFPKQAIVIIHGMGEEIPMDTIKNFVQAVWETDASIGNPDMAKYNPTEVWSKPDIKTGSLELRRITTRQSKDTDSFAKGVRSDFYELYWADLNAGSTLSQVENWIVGLLARNPFKTIPPRLWIAWLLLWLVSVGLFYLAAMSAVKVDCTPKPSEWSLYGWTCHMPLNSLFGPVVAAAIAWGMNKYVVETFGRVVRYTRAKPDNIAARKAIRERGLDLLNALHDRTYDRIIVVGHSLGSILGYDLISYFWASRGQAYAFETDSPGFKLLQKVEQATDVIACAQDKLKALAAEEQDPKTLPGRLKKIPEEISAAKAAIIAGKPGFEEARRALAHFMRTRPKPTEPKSDEKPEPDTRWLITDFITLGSPLTHCEFLLNADHDEFEAHKALRELPTAPPVQELLDPNNKPRAEAADLLLKGKSVPLAKAMAFPFNHDVTIEMTPASEEAPAQTKTETHEFWQLHHAAPFAVVKWTNIYDPLGWGYLAGDIISGPLAPHYGPVITDINLTDKVYMKKRDYWLLTHTKYWSQKNPKKPPAPLVELRKALNLSGDGV